MSDAENHLNLIDRWWRDHYTWLDELGYTLRPRYHPDWVPSWLGTDKSYLRCEDGLRPWYSPAIDAVRKSDGAFVAIKRVVMFGRPYQVSIERYLSSEPLASDPRNHCCPIYEVLQVPDEHDIRLFVMPQLLPYTDPKFTSTGEVMECFRQVIEGLQFMHSHHVAHRNIMGLNIMLDPSTMYPDPYHPCKTSHRRANPNQDVGHYSCTERPSKYYLIDFGRSRRYGPDETNPLEKPLLPIFWANTTAPEFLEDPKAPRNPFHTDIYYLGNTIREDVLKVYTNFEFLEPLVELMVADDPAARPPIDEVAERFDKILKSLSSWTLRSRPIVRTDGARTNFKKDVSHVCKTTTYLVRSLDPLPTPRS